MKATIDGFSLRSAIIAMAPGEKEVDQKGSGEQRQLYQCANCGKPYAARIITTGKSILGINNGCGRCGGEDFIPFETAEIDMTPA